MEIEALAQQSDVGHYDVTASQTALAQADSEATPAVQYAQELGEIALSPLGYASADNRIAMSTGLAQIG